MESINWTAAKFFFDVLQVVFMVLVAVYVWWVNKNRATDTAIDDVRAESKRAVGDIEERVDHMDRRLESIAHDLHHRPSSKELRDLWRKLDETNQGLAKAASTNESLSVQLQMIHQHLLEQRK